jgi:hypothetical protein
MAGFLMPPALGARGEGAGEPMNYVHRGTLWAPERMCHLNFNVLSSSIIPSEQLFSIVAMESNAIAETLFGLLGTGLYVV